MFWLNTLHFALLNFKNHGLIDYVYRSLVELYILRMHISSIDWAAFNFDNLNFIDRCTELHLSSSDLTAIAIVLLYSFIMIIWTPLTLEWVSYRNLSFSSWPAFLVLVVPLLSSSDITAFIMFSCSEWTSESYKNAFIIVWFELHSACFDRNALSIVLLICV